MKSANEKSKWWWRAAVFALVLIKFWLVSGQQSRVISSAGHDDWLFLGNAEHLLKGEWLGPYNELTLAKGPFLSMFIAAANVLQVPFLQAKTALYTAACLLVVLAMRPLVAPRGVRAGLFAVLLFNPITHDWEYLRVMREGLLPGLVLLIVAGLIALHARREQPLGRLWPWSAMLGLALAAFWLTREESVWLLPAIVPLWLYLGWATIRNPKSEVQRPKSGVWSLKSEVWRFGVVLVLPLALWGAGLSVVSYLNWRHYGVWTTCEFKHPSFKAAYGALLRVEHQLAIPGVPVTREARERIYQVSPAFRQLRPYLEGAPGVGWATWSEHLTGLPPEKREITAGWFVWALRGAVHWSGHARTGGQAMAFYAELAKEVNRACDEGRLPATGRRRGLLPPLTSASRERIGPSIRQQLSCFFSLAEVAIEHDVVDPATLGDRARFAALTRERMPLPGVDPSDSPAPSRSLRLTILQRLLQGYHGAIPWTGLTAVLALVAAGVIALRRRRLPYFLVVSIGCLGALLALQIMLAILSVAAIAVLCSPRQVTGGYGLWLLCQFTSWLALAEALGAPGIACDERSATGEDAVRNQEPADRPGDPFPPAAI